MKVITSKIFKGKKMFLIDDENYQDGGAVDSVLNSNKHLEWVKRLYDKNPKTLTLPGEKNPSTHYMESSDNLVYPTIIQTDDGKLKYLGDKARDYAIKNKTYIEFPTEQEAIEFGKNYKTGTGVLSTFQDGGVIEDNQGQWKYPGQITKINSNNITMKGVNYPVLGISNTGHKQLMMPEQEYTFDGQSVTEYPITAQAGTTVKVNKDNVVKEYDRRSPEYKAMYDSGKLMSYDKSTDTYRATPLETFEVKTKAPQWLINKRNIEKNFTKEKFVKKYLPKWSGSMGETADNLSENAQKDYDKKVNDKLANVLLKSNQKKGNKEANNLDWYNSFSEKEREIIQQSSLANKFAPAQRAYDLDVSNSTKKYNTTDVLTDADKLSQSVQGTPERFRLFPNAENNIESYVNPGMFLGSMAKGLGNVPKDIKNENYGQAALSIATPLGVGALAGIGNPSTGQFVNNLTNPFAGTGDLAKGIYNKGITALERNSIRKSIVPELKQVSKTNGISNQLPTPPQEIYFDINTQIPNREVINLNRNRISDLPPAPFVTSDIMPEPINDLLQATRLSDLEYTRLQNLVRNNSNYLQENNIYASDQALNHFMHSNNPNDYINNFLNLSNNTRISDLTDYNIWNNKLNKIDLAKYSNLSYGELVKKNPTLAEKLKKQLTAFKFKSKKFLTELDTHAGKIIKPKQSVNREVLEKDINSLLKKGLGIKKTDIPIQIKTEGSQIKVFLDSEKNGNFIESGYISIPEEGLNQKKLTETLMTLFKKENKGVQKTMDFPTNDIRESNRFPSNINTKGVGGELGEAIKQSLKLQNKNWNLLSSQSHTNEGAARYLTEFLNGRKTPIDISANPEWLKEAEKIKKLYPKGIKKEEVIELMKKNPDLRPTNIKFKYPYGGTIKVLNTKIENGKKYFLINE
jgi:hypothetical protein